MNEATKNHGRWVLWLSLALCILYDSYRYPLQINSSGTSPTYSDTPFLLNVGKFLLSMPMFAIAAWRCVSRKFDSKLLMIVLATLFLSAYSFFKIFEDGEPAYLDAFFWMLFSLILALIVDSVSIQAMNRFFMFLLIYAFGSTAIEVILFITIGRLPALAFDGTYNIRFGGFLDDPNGFAALLFLLLGWSYWRFKGGSRSAVLFGIVVALLLTQSWTAIFFFFLLILVFGIHVALKHPIAGALTLCLLVFAAVWVLNHGGLQLHSDVLEMLFSAKQGSIEGHSFLGPEWSANWPGWLFLGASTYTPLESWWAGTVLNFGIPWACVSMILVGSLVLWLRRARRNASAAGRPICAGVLLFGYYFAAGSLNLPFPAIFPVNFLFFLLAFLIAFDKVEGLQSATDSAEIS